MDHGSIGHPSNGLHGIVDAYTGIYFSANDAIGVRNANNLIYAIPYEVCTNKKSENSHHVIKMEKTCSSGVEVDQLLTLQPICIVEDMVTSGVSISKTRIG